MKNFFQHYRIFLLVLILYVIFYYINPTAGKSTLSGIFENLQDMLLIMPPIFVFLGFLDVWVEKETLIKFMGNNSGIRGILTAFLIGSFAAGPIYMAFPFIEVLLRKEAKFSNVIIFLGAWSATKIPISLFEASVMGWNFMVLRYVLDIPSIILIARLVDSLTKNVDKTILYEKFKTL